MKLIIKNIVLVVIGVFAIWFAFDRFILTGIDFLSLALLQYGLLEMPYKFFGTLAIIWVTFWIGFEFINIGVNSIKKFEIKNKNER